MRAVLRRIESFGGDVINLVLAILHPGDVIRQRYCCFVVIGMGRREAQQSGDLFLIGKVFRCTFLQHLAKLIPEPGVFILVIRRHIFEQTKHFFGAAGANRLDVFRFLEYFARYVQRQVAGVDDAAHKTQIGRQQLLGIVHDEHAAHVELDAVTGIAVIHVEWRMCRDIKQLRVFLVAFHTRVNPSKRFFIVVPDMFVERLVFVVGNLILGPRPQCGSLVHRFILVGDGLAVFLPFLLFHQDGLDDVVRIFVDNGANLVAAEQVILIGAQMQCN